MLLHRPQASYRHAPRAEIVVPALFESSASEVDCPRADLVNGADARRLAQNQAALGAAGLGAARIPAVRPWPVAPLRRALFDRDMARLREGLGGQFS